MQPKYNNQDKAYLRGLKIALDKSIERTTSDPDALRSLIDLEENDPYLVKQKAIELSRDGLLSTSDFKHYYDSANLQQIYKTNKFFRLSDPFNTYESMFKDKDLSAVPGFGLDLILMKNKFREDMVAWHRENSILPEYENQPYKYQKAFNAEVKAIMGEIMSNSQIIQLSYDTLGKQIMNTYGIVITRRKTN